MIEHSISVFPHDGGGARVVCECGARWTINQQELESGEDKLEYHVKYANRPSTKPD